MARAWFEYRGINSIDKYLHIENDISFPSPEADVDFIEILGRDGEVAVNNKRMKNVVFSLPIRIKTPTNITINEIATEISEWLKTDVGWSPLRFSGSPDYEYIAMCHSAFSIEETLKNYGKTVIRFTLKPYKRLINQKIIQVSNGSILVNPNVQNAKPLIKLMGSGNIKIKNNGMDWIQLKGVTKPIEIDCDLMTVYEGGWIPAYNKLLDLGNFPFLGGFENKITWEGDVERLEILPRWEAIT